MWKACYWRNTRRRVKLWTKKPTSIHSSNCSRQSSRSAVANCWRQLCSTIIIWNHIPTSSQRLSVGHFRTSSLLSRPGGIWYSSLSQPASILRCKTIFNSWRSHFSGPVVHNYLSNLDVNFYTIQIAKLLQFYKKCLNSFGNYEIFR